MTYLLIFSICMSIGGISVLWTQWNDSNTIIVQIWQFCIGVGAGIIVACPICAGVFFYDLAKHIYNF